MPNLMKPLFALLAAFAFATTAFASTYGTKEEAVAMVDRAQALLEAEGSDALIREVMNTDNPDFHDRDLYAFVYDGEGKIVAHGTNSALVGRNMMGLRDQNGVYLVRDMVNMAIENSEGWVDYHWANPTTNQVEAKTSYVRMMPDGHIVGVGVYADQ